MIMYKTILIRGMMSILTVTALVLFSYTNAFAPQLGISVTKTCTDAISPNGPIQYSGVVTNTGPWYALTNVTVVDDNGTPGDVNDDVTVLGPITLAVGASASYSGSYVPSTSPSTNTVTAIGYVDYFGTLYSASAQASATCNSTQEGGKCWLTAGGVKFSPITGIMMAEVKQNGPTDSVGGNVYPGCNATSGDGGNWNHIAHSKKLHFQGTDITIVRCGNVPGIEPGSESPVTPYNFIEFQGTGTLKGIGGNKDDFGQVCFWARAEDRNEPGNERALLPGGGADIDRYYLRVFNCSSGQTLLLTDIDGNAATIDPITITGGNFQLHISSCSN
jgi:hypothetical protein